MAPVQTRGRSMRRTTAGILAIAALAAGIAVAFFLSSEEFTGQNADTGVLAVAAALNQDQSYAQDMFPKEEEPADDPASDFGAPFGSGPEGETIAYDVKIENNSFVCSQDGTVTGDNGTPTDPNDDPPADQTLTVGANCGYGTSNTYALDDEVQIKIYSIDDAADNASAGLGLNKTEHYNGPLSGLVFDPDTGEGGGLDELIVVEDGQNVTVYFKVWLDDADHQQPQATAIVWDFLVEARTPSAESSSGL